MLGARESDELHRVGFVIVCGLLDASEVAVVKDAAASDRRRGEEVIELPYGDVCVPDGAIWR